METTVMRKNNLKWVIVALLTMILAGSASAAEIAWTGAGTGDDWGTNTNWQDNTIPDGDWAIIDNTDSKGVPLFNETVPTDVTGIAMGRYTDGNSAMTVTNNTNGRSVRRYIYIGVVTGTHTLNINDDLSVGQRATGTAVKVGRRSSVEGGNLSIINLRAFLDMPKKNIELGKVDPEALTYDAPGHLNVYDGAQILCGNIYVGDYGTGVLNQYGGLIDIQRDDNVFVGLYLGQHAGDDGNADGTVNLYGGMLYSKGFPTIDAHGEGGTGVINFNGGKLGTRDGGTFDTEQAIRDAITNGDWANGVSADPNHPSWRIVQIPAGFTKYKHEGTPQSIWIVSSPPAGPCDMYVGPYDDQDLGILPKGTPGSVDYTVLNGGTASFSYFVAENPDETWLTLSKTAGGPIAGGSSDPVVVTASIDTSTLIAGTYDAYLDFTDDCSTATITRHITFEVVECYLTTDPREAPDSQVDSSMTVYSHCENPQTYSMTVTNSGIGVASYTVAKDATTWLTLNTTGGGPLQPGSSDTITFTVTNVPKGDPDTDPDTNSRQIAELTITPDCGGAAIVRRIARDDTRIGDIWGNKWTYCGNVDPYDPTYIDGDAGGPCGDGCNFTVKTDNDCNGVVFGTVVSDPDAGDGLAFMFDQYGTGAGDGPDPIGRNFYQSNITNPDPLLLTNNNSLSARIGATMVCRIKVIRNGSANAQMMIHDDSTSDPLMFQRARVNWGGPGPGHRRDIVEHLQTPDVSADDLVPVGPEESAYHIIRIATGWGAYGSPASLFRINIWFDEAATPVLEIPSSQFGSNFNYDAFMFGTLSTSSDSIVYYDWISFTDTGIWAPGEEDDCIGSLDEVECVPPCNDPFADVDPATDGDGDVDQDDFAKFQVCYTGDGSFTLPEECECFDRDDNSNVNDADFSAFKACVSGPGVPADTNCD